MMKILLFLRVALVINLHCFATCLYSMEIASPSLEKSLFGTLPVQVIQIVPFKATGSAYDILSTCSRMMQTSTGMRTCFCYNNNTLISLASSHACSNNNFMYNVTDNQFTKIVEYCNQHNKPLPEITIKNRIDAWQLLYGANTLADCECIFAATPVNVNVFVEGQTSLLLNFVTNSQEIVKFLLVNGANADHPNDDGWTPLYFASRGINIGMVKLLLKYGADIHKTNNDGWTPLHTAIHHNNINIAKLLLDNGSDVNAQTNVGWTALHVAVYYRYTIAVELLLKNGANVNYRGLYGIVAYDYLRGDEYYSDEIAQKTSVYYKLKKHTTIQHAFGLMGIAAAAGAFLLFKSNSR